jgi:hypothetical protein
VVRSHTIVERVSADGGQLTVSQAVAARIAAMPSPIRMLSASTLRLH